MKYYHLFILIKNVFSVSSTVWKWGKDVALQCLLDVSFLFFSITCVNIMATAQISKILTACLWFWPTSTKRPKMWSGVWGEEWLLSSKPVFIHHELVECISETWLPIFLLCQMEWPRFEIHLAVINELQNTGCSLLDKK